MRSQRAWMGLFLIVSLATGTVARAADKEKAKEASADLKKLEGKWTAPGGNGGKSTYTFTGTKLKVEAPNRTYEITVTIDEAAKPEKSIDMKIEEAPEDAKGKTSKGIYKFDGDDKFIFCFRPEGERPEKFEMIGFEQIVVELTKEKAEEKKK